MSEFKCWILLIFYLVGIVPICSAGKVMVVLSRSVLPYEQAWQGFSDANLVVAEQANMDGQADKGKAIMMGLSPDTTDLVVTVGSEATTMAQKYLTTIPVVYTMVLQKQEFANSIHSGVILRIKVENQLEVIHKMFPGKVIGVIYNLHYSAKIINEARTVVRRLGETIAPIAIETDDDVPKALEKITADNIGVYWLVVDPTVAKAKSVQLIIKRCLKEKIPLFALSVYHVKAGAFAALSVNFIDMGVQTAEIAKMVMDSKTVPVVTYPRQMILYVNSKTQKEIGVDTVIKIPGVKLVKQ